MMSTGEDEETFPGYMPLAMERQTEKSWRMKLIISFATFAFILTLLLLFALFFRRETQQDNYSDDAVPLEAKEMAKRQWLNITCYNESELEVFGNFIKISQVVANLTTSGRDENVVAGCPSGCTKETVTKLLIFATEKIQIDSHFRRDELGLSKLQLFSLVAPYWSLDYNGVVKFDLGGRNGVSGTGSAENNGNHGKPGEHGGNFVGIYTQANVANKFSSILVNVKGGDGGNGTDGLDGRDGVVGKNATIFDLPPAMEAKEVATSVNEGETVNNLAPGEFVNGVVSKNFTISKLEVAQDPCSWFTAVGFAGGDGEPGGNGGEGGAAGTSGNALFLRLSSASSKHGKLHFNLLQGDGKAGIPGRGGNCGRRGDTGESISCCVHDFGRHIWCNEWHCRRTKFTPQNKGSPNISCDGSSGPIEKQQVPIIKLDIFEIIMKFTGNFILNIPNPQYDNKFLQHLHNSSDLIQFLSPESFWEQFLLIDLECQKIQSNNICCYLYKMFLERLKIYRNNVETSLKDNDIITLDLLHTFTLLAVQRYENGSRMTATKDFSLLNVRERAEKLENTIAAFQNIHIAENDSSCRAILYNVTHPSYDSVFLGKSLGLLDATQVLQKLILKCSEQGSRMMYDLFPSFVNTSGFAISLEKYLHDPLLTIQDRNCSMMIQFGRLAKEVEENLDTVRFENWLPIIANRVSEDNVFQIIQDYKLGNVSPAMQYSTKHPTRSNFTATLLSTLKNAPPWLSASCENDGETLLIFGNVIKFSWLADGDLDELENFSIIGPQPCELKSVKKLALFASETVYLDLSLARQKSFESLINISIIAPKLIIEKKVTLDLSGLDAESPKPKPISICSMPGNSGENGENGGGGGNGGNVLIMFSEAFNTDQLTIIVDGGTGGIGQDGADGCDGQRGKNASLENFPYTTPYFYDRPSRDKLQQELLEPCGFYQSNISKNGILEKHDHTRWSTAIGFPGGRGGDGGNGGDGGRGGLRGIAEVVQLPKYDNTGQFNATISSRNGMPGVMGIGGNAGKEGARGDNYSCKWIISRTWAECYSSCNCRTTLYRHFKDGKADPAIPQLIVPHLQRKRHQFFAATFTHT